MPVEIIILTLTNLNYSWTVVKRGDGRAEIVANTSCLELRPPDQHRIVVASAKAVAPKATITDALVDARAVLDSFCVLPKAQWRLGSKRYSEATSLIADEINRRSSRFMALATGAPYEKPPFPVRTGQAAR
jgi:hypothetical protein